MSRPVLPPVLKPQFPISKWSKGPYQSFSLTSKEHSWVEELLLELSDNHDLLDPQEFKEKGELKLKLQLKKDFLGSYGEFLLIKASVEGHYLTHCVKSLLPMTEKLEFSFEACLLEDHLQEKEEFQETTEIYIQDGVYEVYFMVKGICDLKEVFHEQLILHRNPYPSLEVSLDIPSTLKH